MGKDVGEIAGTPVGTTLGTSRSDDDSKLLVGPVVSLVASLVAILSNCAIAVAAEWLNSGLGFDNGEEVAIAEGAGPRLPVEMCLARSDNFLLFFVKHVEADDNSNSSATNNEPSNCAQSDLAFLCLRCIRHCFCAKY